MHLGEFTCNKKECSNFSTFLHLYNMYTTCAVSRDITRQECQHSYIPNNVYPNRDLATFPVEWTWSASTTFGRPLTDSSHKWKGLPLRREPGNEVASSNDWATEATESKKDEHLVPTAHLLTKCSSFSKFWPTNSSLYMSTGLSRTQRGLN